MIRSENTELTPYFGLPKWRPVLQGSFESSSSSLFVVDASGDCLVGATPQGLGEDDVVGDGLMPEGLVEQAADLLGGVVDQGCQVFGGVRGGQAMAGSGSSGAVAV